MLNAKKLRYAIGVISAAVLLTVISFIIPVSAATEYTTYTYSNTGDICYSPDIYSVGSVVTGADGNIGALLKPSDMAIDKNGKIYIADTGNNRIVIFDSDFSNAVAFSEFKLKDGSLTTLAEPQGICVDSSGRIYVCDTGNNRIICSDINANVIMEITKPDSQYFTEGIEFIPKRIAVDSAANIYVSSVGAYQGLSLFTSEGVFAGFYGAEEVETTADVLKDYVWKQFMSQEQKDAMASYIPPEACNIYINNRDFVLTISNSYYIPNTSEKGEMDSIRLLNPKGVNTINLDSSKFSGKAISEDAKTLNFIAGCIDENGFLTLIENSKNRIFRFDNAMNLIGVFGGKGEKEGKFTTPSDVDVYGEKLYVLDSYNGTITVFEETDYGALIHNALVIYNTSEQSKAIEPWKQVLTYNSNYDLAYVGIGRALLNSGNAKEAMRYFELGHDSALYNDAFSVYRTEVIRSYGAVVIALILVLYVVYVVLKRKGIIASVKVDATSNKGAAMCYAIKHPFDGFERLKSKKLISLPLSFVCLGIFAFLRLFQIQFTGKQFDMLNINDINIFWEIGGMIAVLVVWTISNWCFSVLIEGKANFKEIWIISSYCLIPYSVAGYIKVILSNFLVREEGFFSTVIVIVGILWSLLMIIGAFSNFHEFEGFEIFKAILLTLLGMAIILVLIFVVYMLVQQFVSTFLQLFNEILFGIKVGWR